MPTALCNIKRPFLQVIFAEPERPRMTYAAEFPGKCCHRNWAAALAGPVGGGERAFCPDEKPLKSLQKISGKVVLIDEVDSVGDVHESVVGKLPGYPMQAKRDGLFGDRDNPYVVYLQK